MSKGVTELEVNSKIIVLAAAVRITCEHKQTRAEAERLVKAAFQSQARNGVLDQSSSNEGSEVTEFYPRFEVEPG